MRRLPAVPLVEGSDVPASSSVCPVRLSISSSSALAVFPSSPLSNNCDSLAKSFDSVGTTVLDASRLSDSILTAKNYYNKIRRIELMLIISGQINPLVDSMELYFYARSDRSMSKPLIPLRFLVRFFKIRFLLSEAGP